MVAQADHVEWMVVDSEVEALILEHNLIQAHQPRYNVRLKDDKSYPWLAVTLNEEWPRPAVVRGRKRKGVRYFGPYGNAGAIRSTLDLLRAELPGPHVLGHQVRAATSAWAGPACSTTSSGARGRAWAPSTTRPTTATWPTSMRVPLRRHRAGAERGWRRRCCEASDDLEFERAARAAGPHRRGAQGGRGRSRWCSTAPRTSTWSALAEDPLEASVQIFHVRPGRVVGHRGFVAEKVEDLARPEFMALVVGRSTAPTARRCPRRVLVPEHAGRPRRCSQTWLRTGAGARSTSRSRCAGPSAPCRRRWTRNGRRGPAPATACAGRRTTTAAVQGADRAAGRAAPAARRRCASSATT